MAHRIAKKQQAKINSESTQPQNQTPGYFNQDQTQQSIQNHVKGSKLPRPLMPSTNTIINHDKYSYRQNKFGFPPAQSLFVCNNSYDANPQFLRPTSAYIFGNPKKSNFPLGVWITPFGSQNVHKIRVNSPLRCSRCKAYVNGYFRFDGTKTSATCNICGINFQIDGSTDQNNLTSPQIATQGIIDFIVRDKIFIKKRTDIIKILIVIQINSFMIQSNAFNTIIDSAKSAIQNSQFQKNIRMGIVIFNGQGVTYPKLSNSQNWNTKIPQFYTVKNSGHGLCCPLSDKQLLYDPTLEKDKLLYLLDCISNLGLQQYKNSKYLTHGANYILALKSIINNFENQVGRIMLFTHTAPKTGIMALRPRNQQDNKIPLKPLTTDYYQFSKELVKVRVGVDFYIITKEVLASQELSTMHYIASHTGGNIHLYSPYTPYNHSENLYYNIYGSLSRKYVYDVNFTARFSSGLNVNSYCIGDGIHQTRDISLAIFDKTSSIVVNYQQQQKIQQNNAAFIQYAMMFTTGDGQRIIRIINYRFLITNKIQVIHEASDYLAVANIILRQAAHKLLRGDPTKARQDLINRLIGMVTQYVQQGGNRTKISNFLQHPNLSPAFAYIHTFINSKVFLNSLKIPADYQICQALKITTASFINFSNFFYPKLFSIGMQIYQEQLVPGDLIQGQGDIQQSVILPPSLPLSSQSITKQGIYLHWSSDYLTILIQTQTPSQVLLQLFGTDNWQQIQQLNSLPQLQTSHNIRITMIIQQLRRRNTKYNGIFLPLLIRTPKRKGPYNDILHHILKEDYQECRYYSFLDTIHRQVQLRIK